MRAWVVVLGDLERSPRMVNHARSLAAMGADVDLVGYGEGPSTALGAGPPDLQLDSRVRCHLLREPLATSRGALTYSIRAAARMATLAARLLYVFFLRLPRPDVILVQTPPALPTLSVALLAARVRRARLVVDWHNLTHSIVALKTGARHPLVRAIERYERVMGRRADAHLCVSQAMADRLATWGINASVVRDRPSERFRPGRVNSERHLIVVPSSWSEDDDFDLLLAAIEALEGRIAAHDEAHPRSAFPPVDVLLTGRGPLRARYRPLFERRSAHRVRAESRWLSGTEYADIMSRATIGISIHRSASGVDLPMKICDMFGAGVPVCALDYGPCLAELVRDGKNGVFFRTAQELADALFLLLDPSSGLERLDALRHGAAASGRVRWHDGWVTEAWPVLRG